MTPTAFNCATIALALAACRGQASPQQRAWPKTVAFTPLERRAAGCYRVHGVSQSDSANTGFAADSILRLDLSVLRVVIPPLGSAAVGEYVNEHPFSPQPENFDTVWWRARNETSVGRSAASRVSIAQAVRPMAARHHYELERNASAQIYSPAQRLASHSFV